MKFLGPPSSGSLAAVVYSRNQFGQYQRARTAPTQPTSPAAIAARALFASAVAAWAALTPEQQLTWDSYAATLRPTDNLGQPKRTTGRLQFLAAAQSAGTTAVTPGAESVSVQPAAAPLLFADPAPLYNLNAVFTISGPCTVKAYTPGYTPTSINSPPGKGRYWQLCSTINLTAVPAGQYSSLIGPDIIALFGAPTVGLWSFVRLVALNLSGTPGAPVMIGRIQY